ncbi:class I SAM-dependent methyltransferase [Aquimarina sp. 2201CG5-10]|uniref:class I SAM-dependent methyltransferase n=1 Tax=Aquimarina callyspongiae TaxID=3098150 RepID=UPI002AB35910|nr:class I SAM-dependent methyltransferase [Aquimarina sp. 2201CG5-10]MDY8134906.1 class I SAM-dependent methyltransferase [Aquimarina sp. 2201CG5-10]
MDKRKHWENVYNTKELKDVSWYQEAPKTSLDFLSDFKVSKTAKIIDAGGGDSLLVDHLLKLGYSNITVLDISETAINKAKKRLGDQAEKVKWIIADIASFVPIEKYDVWHDRATFHFLTKKEDINHYVSTIQKNTVPNGTLIIGTFSKEGPKKCSGIDITQYSETSLNALLNQHFEKIKCIYIDHQTPFNTSQNFVFCGFKKIVKNISKL